MQRLENASEVSRISERMDRRMALSAARPLQQPERMPFTIRIAHDEQDLERALTIRRAAYGRHLPEFAQSMAVEASDRAPGSTILLAESKFDGAPIGTMRIQTNEFDALPVQSSVILPPWCASGRLAEATRLGVAGGSPGRVVKMMLFKALFLYCEQQHIDWMVITARAPIDREYESMMFRDIYEAGQFLPMSHVGGLPHRVMAGEVGVARQRWGEAGHPLFRFVFQTHHPDIDLRSTKDIALVSETVGCQESSVTAGN